MPGPIAPRGPAIRSPRIWARPYPGCWVSHPQQAALMAVFGCLLISVFTNIGGSYMMRGIINDFIWSGCTDFAGLGRAILVLVGIYLIGCAATYGQSAVMVRLAQRGINRLRKDLFDKLQDLPLYIEAYENKKKDEMESARLWDFILQYFRT